MAHIRDERATRTNANLVGSKSELPNNLCTAWCGANANGTWFFVSADHALLSLRYGGRIAPCQECLTAIRDLVVFELRGVEGK